jgi:hypothetical protein
MESENWARVKQIVNECLDLEAAKRKDHIAQAWRRITNPAAISASGFACGNPRDVVRMISLCDAALGERRDR